MEIRRFTLTELLPEYPRFAVEAFESVPHVMTDLWRIKFPGSGDNGHWMIHSGDTLYLRLRGLDYNEPSSAYVEIIKKKASGDTQRLLAAPYERFAGQNIMQLFAADTKFIGDQFLVIRVRANIPIVAALSTFAVDISHYDGAEDKR